jgi:NAD(P)-dependent dehydrogenase (short-subunit alcohol dehydrogenase family)
MTNDRRFEDKTALITGGASGIGRATALRLASEGCAVAVADLNEAAGLDAVREITACGGRGIFLHADVLQPEENRRLVAATVEAFGKLDVFFPSAGVGAWATMLTLTEEEWDRVVDLDLKAVFVGCKHAVEQMAAQGQGAIVLVSSLGGVLGNFAPHFAAAKGGVIQLAKSIAVLHARDGIRANCVCPGYIDTPILAGNAVEWMDAAAASAPMSRLGTADEVAAAIAFLASDDAAFITGVALPVDGGYLAQGRF